MAARMKHPLPTVQDQVDFCAFCQNPCRTGAGDEVVPESRTPSAMAFLTRAVRREHLVLTEDLRAHLSDCDGVRLMQRQCLYGYDIAGGIDRILAELAD